MLSNIVRVYVDMARMRALQVAATRKPIDHAPVVMSFSVCVGGEGQQDYQTALEEEVANIEDSEWDAAVSQTTPTQTWTTACGSPPETP